ncbi:MAG: YebC/PmpR family DNA-binding transcriptional regulator [Candidatus Falkowbacteria bacterium]|nr:YebC/PmpR family DNA-binding transcriptional regulator [Candidatus Falkowbacteria bacterium]
MSGHSKWATTKRAKAVVDAKRGTVFTKISNIITIAARKGGDPAMNFALAQAVDQARAVNMPKDNIERAIKRGTGEGGGQAIEELVYEGHGPAQSQFVVRVLTDSRNRAASNIRHLFSKSGGSLGAVLWNFDHKGVILISEENWETSKYSWDDFVLESIDNGVDDIIHEENGVIIYTKPEDLMKAKVWLESKNLKTESAAMEYVAKEKLILNENDKAKVESFIEALDDDEDVSDYFTNAEI